MHGQSEVLCSFIFPSSIDLRVYRCEEHCNPLIGITLSFMVIHHISSGLNILELSIGHPSSPPPSVDRIFSVETEKVCFMGVSTLCDSGQESLERIVDQ